jgi:hypothetical protein
MLTRWHPASHTEFVLCLDAPVDMQKRLSLQVPSIDRKDAYAWHTVFLAEIRDLYDTSVWSLRHLVRGIEKVGRMINNYIRSRVETKTVSAGTRYTRRLAA